MGTRHNLFRLLLRAKKSAIGSWGFLFVLVFLVFGVFFVFVSRKEQSSWVPSQDLGKNPRGESQGRQRASVEKQGSEEDLPPSLYLEVSPILVCS